MMMHAAVSCAILHLVKIVLLFQGNAGSISGGYASSMWGGTTSNILHVFATGGYRHPWHRAA